MSTMRDCSNIRNLLGSYVDGELDDASVWTVEKHCATCSVCSRIAADLGATARLLRELPIEEPSADFDARLAARLADVVLAAPRPSWRDRWFRPRVLRPVHRTAPVRAFAIAAAACLLAAPLVRAPFAARNAATPGEVAVSEPVALEDIVQDHVHAASSEPLGGTSGMLLASTAGSSSGPSGY